MRRRDFITLIGGAAVAWPFGVWAQAERPRRIALLMPNVESDPQAQIRNGAFLKGLHQSGWTTGHNLVIEYRWSGANPEDIRRHAAELVALTPEVIVASGSATMGALLQATRTIPVVFINVADPVGAGYVDSLARPGRNATGLVLFEYGLSGKWLELLKQLAPNVTRALVIRDPTITAGIGQWAAIQSVAPSIGIEVNPINASEVGELERAVEAFSRSGNAGLIATGGPLTLLHRDLIISLAERHKLPAVYYEKYFVISGGLMSYGPDIEDQFRLAAVYVDRILKGEKPGDLPVQAPTKYELAINRKTAAALGLVIPDKLLSTADQVIE